MKTLAILNLIFIAIYWGYLYKIDEYEIFFHPPTIGRMLLVPLTIIEIVVIIAFILNNLP